MGIPSSGLYGIPKEVMFGYPVVCEGGEYKVVEGLSIDEFSQSCIDKTLKVNRNLEASFSYYWSFGSLFVLGD
jgi:malate/lactate dehydrogenase